MQIIINRIAVVIDDRSWVAKLKVKAKYFFHFGSSMLTDVQYGTAAIITLVNIMVFIIWIPAHLSPPPIPL
jgi:hypothetical protein